MLTLTIFGALLILAYFIADRLDNQDERARRLKARARGRK
jgi:hypothetical protein